MSRFFTDRFASLTPYTPGEQPQERQYVKLNTNENPFPPSPMAVREAALAAENLQLYSDPECTKLTQVLSEMYGVAKDITMGAAGRVPYRTKIPNVLLAGQNINSHGMLGVLVGTIVTCSELVSSDIIYKQISNQFINE